MSAFTVIASLWGLVGFTFVIAMVYRASLGNHETDQLFLNDEETVSSSHKENDEIIHRLDTLVPICKGLGGATILLTLVMAGMMIARIVA